MDLPKVVLLHDHEYDKVIWSVEIKVEEKFKNDFNKLFFSEENNWRWLAPWFRYNKDWTIELLEISITKLWEPK